jgi:hypothetical protein
MKDTETVFEKVKIIFENNGDRYLAMIKILKKKDY